MKPIKKEEMAKTIKILVDINVPMAQNYPASDRSFKALAIAEGNKELYQL